MKECDIFRRVITYSDHPTYSQGSSPQTPRIYAPAVAYLNLLHIDVQIWYQVYIFQICLLFCLCDCCFQFEILFSVVRAFRLLIYFQLLLLLFSCNSV